MARIALSFALVSIASSLFAGCVASTNPESTDQESAAEQACVYASDAHVIMCVPPPEPTPVSKPGSSAPASNASPSPSSSSGLLTVCATLKKDLASELAAAQVCTIGEAPIPECQAWVPTDIGCVAPVALANSPATHAYLETWGEYASKCPLEHAPCPDVVEDGKCEPGASSANGKGHCVGMNGPNPSPSPVPASE